MSSRKIETSYRIIKILRLLFEKPRELEELCCMLDGEGQSVKRNTITKYFATLREFGCIIEKKNHKFVLKYFPCFIRLEQKDIDVLQNLEIFAQELLGTKLHEKIQNATRKILERTKGKNYAMQNFRFSPTALYRKHRKKIEQISFCMQGEPEKIKILYRDNFFTVSPQNFRYRNNKIYLMAFDEKNLTNRQFLLDDIEEITNLSQISSRFNFAQTTVFRLKGRVAKGYTSPYESEIITYEKDGSILVENKYEDKIILRKRLLKYFDMCEILSPKVEREEFIKSVEFLVKKYS